MNFQNLNFDYVEPPRECPSKLTPPLACLVLVFLPTAQPIRIAHIV